MRHYRTLEEYEIMCSDGDQGGWCLACGTEAYGIEPDARGYECESCKKHQVYAAEEWLLMGLVS